ncbi:FecR domain-containing protein [Massilia sp. ST3]|uniref:FecR family protein n=1 Tax=Massilia sp. ST3 TaxID=2824903 RepID=UPI001B832329|nr:FecR family protein [Massilia sp. ST3]MBQ5946955.1 FecR domain-containing protein [Massilia sp. ST3]
MKNLRLNCTAIKAVLFAVLLGFGGAAWAAQVAGMITRLSGPLLAKKADGSVKVLALRSEIESGDTLVSEKNTYAQIKFVDNSEITLRPGTTFKVEDFSFDQNKPEDDKASYSLVKGGLRSITGLMGKRNKEKFSLKTPTATIGIRGTTFVVQYVPPPAAGANGLRVVDSVDMPGLSDEMVQNLAGKNGAGQGKVARGADGPVNPGPQQKLPPGLHLQVTDGAIIVTNNGGALGFQAGQFGYVPSVNQPPVIVPSNPGIQFVPPPSFDAGSGGPTASNGSGQGDATDCIVR